MIYDESEFAKHENRISRVVFDLSLQIHRELGPGLFESVYEEILFDGLCDYGFSVRRQQKIPICFKKFHFDKGFKADLIVDDKVILEIKSVESIADIHRMQLKTYLKLTGLKLGMLINFNVDLLKNGVTRIANGL